MTDPGATVRTIAATIAIGTAFILVMGGAIFLVGYLCERYVDQPQRPISHVPLMRIVDSVGSAVAHAIVYVACLASLIGIGVVLLGYTLGYLAWFAGLVSTTVLIAAWLVHLATSWILHLIGIG